MYLFLGKKDAIIPCTSKAVIETLDFYNIDLTGKKVAVVGRSNIVGKPLIPQLLAARNNKLTTDDKRHLLRLADEFCIDTQKLNIDFSNIN